MEKNNINEVSVPNIRWIMHLKNGKMIVENHDHDRTWRKIYKDNFGNIEALCFQLIPEGTKYFISPSPFGEYWTFEDMETPFGGSTRHIARSICSLQEKNLETMQTIWNVITIDGNKNITKSKMYGDEIGYSTL